MELAGKNVLIVEGSLLSTQELKEALEEAGATAIVTANLISAFSLLERVKFDGAIIDQTLHNEAFDLCTELKSVGTPYISCNAPHRLQGGSARKRAAQLAAEKLVRLLTEVDEPEVETGILSQFLKTRSGMSGGGFGEPSRSL
jgi:hypothetical protein